MRGRSDLILVFVNLLCHCDQDGFCDRHWQAIIDETGLSKDRVLAAINELEGPDTDSRTTENDGRRIHRIDLNRTWGWEVINYVKYRKIQREEERREYMRELMRKKRSKQSVSTCYQPLAMLAQAEVEVDTDTDTDTDTQKTTWMTPFWNVWKEIYGGDIPLKRWVRILTPLLKQHTEADVVKAFGNYIKSVDVQYQKPGDLQAAFGKYLKGEGHGQTKQRNRGEYPEDIKVRII